MVRHGIDARVLQIGGPIDPPETDRSAPSFVADLTDDALEHLERVYPLGHRVVCLLYGLAGCQQRGHQEIASVLSVSVQYVYSIRYWSVQLVREYLKRQLA